MLRRRSEGLSARGSHYSAPWTPPTPPEPVPPGPYDRLVPALDGLESYTTPYNSPTGTLIVRIIARNNGNTMPGLQVTWGGNPMTVAAEVGNAAEGAPIAFLAGIKGSVTGTNELTIECTTGSAGLAAVRIGDLQTMDDDWVGDIQSATGTDNLFDLTMAGLEAPGTSNLTQLCGWMDQQATPITQYYGATEQWQTYQYRLDAELVVNGGFDTDTDWNKGTGWSIADGVATRGLHASIATQLRQQPVALTPGDRYLNSYEITATEGGTVRFMWALNVGHRPDGIPRVEVGTYQQEVLVQAGTGNSQTVGYGIRGDADVVSVSVDNFSLRKILGGMCAWFGQQTSETASTQYTFEASKVAQGVALIVEIKGLVPPP